MAEPTGGRGADRLLPIPGTWFLVVDMLLIGVASMLAAALARFGHGVAPTTADVLPEASQGYWVAWTAAHILLIPLGLLVLNQYRFLEDVRSGWSVQRVVLVATFSFAGLAAFLYFSGQPVTDVLRVGLNFLLIVMFLSGWRSASQAYLRKLVVGGRRATNVLLVGADVNLVSLARDLVADPLHGRRVVGFVRDTPPPAPQPRSSMWVPGHTADVGTAATENSLHQPRHLWVSMPAHDDTARQRIVDALGVEELFLSNRIDDGEMVAWVRIAQNRGIDVHLVPYTHDQLGFTPQPWLLGRRVLLDIHRRPIHRLGWVAKRILDLVGATVGLVVGSPLMVLAAIAIKVESPSLPVFFAGQRVGLKGRSFTMLKFTTMKADAQTLEADLQGLNEREGPWFKVDPARDPRLTRVGRLIRRLSINEIPQFWNVLVGDMSLVGPRPPTPAEVATYLDHDVRYFQVLDVKPGITGLWQVTARHDPSFDRRLELDLQYMRTWNIRLDIRILFKTVGTVLFTKES